MNPHGRPTVRQLRNLRVTGVRTVLFPQAMWVSYYRELEAARFDHAVVLTGQSFVSAAPDWGGMAAEAREHARQIDPWWVIGNEWNVEIDATWPPGGDEAFVGLWNAVAPAIHEVRPEARLYVGGLFSEPDPIRHLRQVWPRLDPKPTGVDYHPYQEGYEQTGQLFHQIRRALGCEVSALEWNDSDPDGLRRFARILDGSTDHWAYFCLDDRMVAEHGVIDADGKRKPTWYALRDALS